MRKLPTNFFMPQKKFSWCKFSCKTLNCSFQAITVPKDSQFCFAVILVFIFCVDYGFLQKHLPLMVGFACWTRQILPRNYLVMESRWVVPRCLKDRPVPAGLKPQFRTDRRRAKSSYSISLSSFDNTFRWACGWNRGEAIFDSRSHLPLKRWHTTDRLRFVLFLFRFWFVFVFLMDFMSHDYMIEIFY